MQEEQNELIESEVQSTNTYVEVAVPTLIGQTFTYLIPQNKIIKEGSLISVPFGAKTLIGLVIGFKKKIDFPKEKLKFFKDD